MFSLIHDYNDYIFLNGIKCRVNLSFDTVLMNMELTQDDDLSHALKTDISLENFLGLCFLDSVSYEVRMDVYSELLQRFIFPNTQKSKTNKSSKNKTFYSFNEDAGFIFSSFLKDYGINLREERGKLHWEEFKALFESLGEDTKISQVIAIRSWEPSKDTSKEEKQRMQELQRVYALKQSQEVYEALEVEKAKMENMTLEEQKEYARKMYEELQKGG